jgi:hypothetical protein
MTDRTEFGAACLAALATLTDDEHAEVHALPAAAYVRYMTCRAEGTAHRLAIVLATGQFPGVRTDVEFNRGRCNGNQFERCPGLGDYYRRAAEAAGVSTTGKYYSAALAEYPGDPEAWVADRHDVLAVARRKGLKVEGLVEYTPPEVEPIPEVGLADDLVAREVDEVLALDPGRRREDVAEDVRALRSGLVDESPLLVSDPCPTP